MTHMFSTGRLASMRGVRAVIGLGFGATIGCQGANERLLSVVDPDIINPSDVVSPEAAVQKPNYRLIMLRLS